jgi:ElaB/YqjD/DUF883 family membrane-anchored ribosome-binding protein
MGGKTLRAELDELRAELARMRQAPGTAKDEAHGAVEAEGTGLGEQLAELNRLVQQMLDEAEETITDHPVATVAGALALGIVIGRLTAR